MIAGLAAARCIREACGLGGHRTPGGNQWPGDPHPLPSACSRTSRSGSLRARTIAGTLTTPWIRPRRTLAFCAMSRLATRSCSCRDATLSTRGAHRLD